jgi:diacylglycerol kinase
MKFLRNQFNSFKFAFKGLAFFFNTEQKAKVHLVLALTAITLGLILKLDTSEWCFVVAAIVFVFITEIINSSINVV